MYSKLFEEALRESDETIEDYYRREDPDSYEALYEEEKDEDEERSVRDRQVICSFIDKKNRHYEFVWQRSKSNENRKHGGFTHYLSRYAYADEFRIVDGQNRGNKVVEIKTKKGNIGILCAMSLTRFGIADDEERGIPEEVLLLVRQEKLQDGKIRLISCYPVNGNSKYCKLYIDNFIDRIRYGTKRPDILDKLDKTDESILSTHRNRIRENSKPLIEKIIRKNELFYIEHFKKGYSIFQRIISEKKTTMNLRQSVSSS